MKLSLGAGQVCCSDECGSSTVSTSIVCRAVPGLRPLPSRRGAPPAHCPPQHTLCSWQVRTKGDFRAAPVRTVTRFTRRLERRSPVLCTTCTHAYAGVHRTGPHPCPGCGAGPLHLSSGGSLLSSALVLVEKNVSLCHAGMIDSFQQVSKYSFLKLKNITHVQM